MFVDHTIFNTAEVNISINTNANLLGGNKLVTYTFHCLILVKETGSASINRLKYEPVLLSPSDGANFYPLRSHRNIIHI
jgi:hypothetical protein